MKESLIKDIERTLISPNNVGYCVHKVVLHPSSDHNQQSFIVHITIKNVITSIKMDIDRLFPFSKPSYYLSEPEIFGYIPHIEKNGLICYSESVGEVIDYHNPLGIIKWSFEMALQTIQESVEYKNIEDWIDEFDAYWGRISDKIYFNSFVQPSDRICEIFVREKEKNSTLTISRIDNMDEYINVKLKHNTIRKGLLIPLLNIEASDIPKLLEYSQIKYLEGIRELCWKSLTNEDNKRLHKEIGGKIRTTEYILFSFPRFKGGESLFGFRFRGNKSHPLIPNSHPDQTSLLCPVRYDKTYIKPRGGVDQTLSKKKILLVGCGAIGGGIASELVKSGISKITLVDYDIFTSTNIYRNVTGKSEISKNKAQGLKNYLDKIIPYLEINVVEGRIEDLVLSDKIQLDDFDIIVVAIDKLTIALWLNQFAHQNKTPPILYTWLEPFGIGSHVVLTHLPDSKGCLECLMYNENNEMQELLSFVKQGQIFTKSLTGCSDLFVPYSSIHVTKTSILAIEIIIDYFYGRITEHLVRSEKGSQEEFIENGFSVSDRYINSKEKKIELKGDEFVRATCKVCYDK